MKVSDYIVSFLVEKGVTAAFGYPGGMVTHLMDSFATSDKITAHVMYHEQGAAFAACGYAQAAGRLGVAYATSGPGATNLVTGIANAYFDSIPTLFITGQVNTYESRGALPLRQKGFQEMDVVELTRSISKYSALVDDVNDIRLHLERAFYGATQGRPGPAVLDIPMNIQRLDVEPHQLRGIDPAAAPAGAAARHADTVIDLLVKAKRPLVLAGAGVASSAQSSAFREWIDATHLPVVTSMLAVDLLPGRPRFAGFIGAYGSRTANILASKADLIVSLGSRLDIRQTGSNPSMFAQNAQLVRVDIDPAELSNRIHDDELQLEADLRDILPALRDRSREVSVDDRWISTVDQIRSNLSNVDGEEPNELVSLISECIPASAIVTTDVGQNQVWVAQSFDARGQRILFSGGHGAMGYSLPAAIGAFYGTGKPVFAFMGDGGLQMNVQELQVLAREQLPVKVILLNNKSLGMIRHFQEMYFDSEFTHTIASRGYVAPDFQRVAFGFNIPYFRFDGTLPELQNALVAPGPGIIEIDLGESTYISPKLAVGKPPYDQEPPLPYNVLQSLLDI